MSVSGAELNDALVEAAVRGATAARATLLAALEPRVRLMTIARLSPTPAQWHAVDDIVQEVMLALTRRLADLQHPTVDGLSAFVSGVVARQVALQVRRECDSPAATEAAIKSLDSTVAAMSSIGPLWQFLSTDRTTPSGALERAEQLQRLLAALGRLKPEYREAITLKVFDGLKTAEVARQMSMSSAAASMLVIRALRALRREMIGNGGGPAHNAD